MSSVHSIKIIDHGFTANEASPSLAPSNGKIPSRSLAMDDKGGLLTNINENAGPKTRPTPAVLVRGAVKLYGSKHILKNLDMTVPQGEMCVVDYSLLGSSGCGKTTLLTCILGIKQFGGGTIEVFGYKAGSRESGVPGRLVGYMPQDEAVYKVFSIGETFQFFGSLNGMTNKAIKEQTKSLIELLELPAKSRKVGTLSGGQGRRLSLAIALIHSPRLIILDEPTVGVDPLLREKIWEYLVEYVKLNCSTVIITTHYIDEARHSNTIGVMRDGRILIEQSPQNLYAMYSTIILEDIVLKLCHEDEMKAGTVPEPVKSPPSKISNLGEGDTSVSPSQPQELEFENAEKNAQDLVTMPKPKRGGCCEYLCADMKSSATRVWTLTKKNTIVTWRNYLFIGFIMTFPSLIMVPLIMAIAGGPRNLEIAVVNLELPVSQRQTGCSKLQLQPNICVFDKFSCIFLSRLPKHIVTLTYMKNEKEALRELKNANQHAMLVFPEVFTSTLIENVMRISNPGFVRPDNLTDPKKAVLRVRVDESHPLTGKAIRVTVTEAFFAFVKELKTLCNDTFVFPQDLATVPYTFEKPVYGGTSDEATAFVACGFLIGFTFFFGNISSAMSLVWDKKQGTLERSQVNGVKTWEILLAQSFTESVLIVLQISVAYFVLIVVYQTENSGSHFLAMSILALSGIMGNAHGFLWAAITDEEINVQLMSMAAYFPGYFLSGLNYPRESFPSWLQYVSSVLPTTLPSESLRSILFRGMNFSRPQVYLGFVGAFSWSAVMLIATILVHAILHRRR